MHQYRSAPLQGLGYSHDVPGYGVHPRGPAHGDILGDVARLHIRPVELVVRSINQSINEVFNQSINQGKIVPDV